MSRRSRELYCQCRNVEIQRRDVQEGEIFNVARDIPESHLSQRRDFEIQRRDVPEHVEIQRRDVEANVVIL